MNGDLNIARNMRLRRQPKPPPDRAVFADSTAWFDGLAASRGQPL